MKSGDKKPTLQQQSSNTTRQEARGRHTSRHDRRPTCLREITTKGGGGLVESIEDLVVALPDDLKDKEDAGVLQAAKGKG
jgi:hypothetical protein